jgi:hypothetical protein
MQPLQVLQGLQLTQMVSVLSHGPALPLPLHWGVASTLEDHQAWWGRGHESGATAH